jgi:glycosyltransferase involved in cell wall biosynthesis
MRLCLIVPGFSAAEDDWCIPALHHLVRRLAAAHEVTVLALRHPPRKDPYSFFGARVLPLAAGTRTGAWRVALLLRALATVKREHRRRPFDVIHGLWADEAGFVAIAGGRRLGVRSVVSVMGGELVGLTDIGYGVQLGGAGRWLVRHSLTGADAVTVGSEALLGRVGAVRGRRPIELAPLGVDTSLFRPDGGRADLPGDPCLLQVASLTPVKNQRLLLEAFAEVAAGHPEARLHLVGAGPLEAALVSRARSLGLDERVVFHGAVPHHELPPVYRAADLHVVSSRFESQGMAVLEAAACGTATVGTPVGILPELARDGAARTVPSADPGALAAALLALLEDRQQIRLLGGAAVARIREDLTVEKFVQRLERICADAVPPHRVP